MEIYSGAYQNLSSISRCLMSLSRSLTTFPFKYLLGLKQLSKLWRQNNKSYRINYADKTKHMKWNDPETVLRCDPQLKDGPLSTLLSIKCSRFSFLNK